MWLMVFVVNTFLTFTSISVSHVAFLAHAVVTSLSVDTIGVCIAFMVAGTAFVEFSTVKFVYTSISRQTFTHIGTDCIYTFCI